MIYKTWIKDMGIDGFRIDTMKHVNDEFWQKFGPEVLAYAKSQGKKEFFMFGEVFDLSRPFTSSFTTRDTMQAVLDFPFQDAARNFASKGAPTSQLGTFFRNDDWYLPTPTPTSTSCQRSLVTTTWAGSASL